MASASASKLDYLKKYLTSEKDTEKRKKKKKTPVNPKATGGIIVIDSDISARVPITYNRSLVKKCLEVEVEEDEGPTVAEVVDETIPKGMQDGTKWKSIAINVQKEICSPGTSFNRQEMQDSGLTPGRKSNLKPAGNRSTLIRNKSSDSDLSPQRPSKRSRSTPDSDLSPVRNVMPIDPSRHGITINTRRKSGNNSDSDLPPFRIYRSHDAHRQTGIRKEDSRSSKVRSGSSPVGNRHDVSPLNQRIKQEVITPIRKSPRSSDSERSPVRIRSSTMRSNRSSRREIEIRKDVQKLLPTKTLSGMTAGLQNAETLRKETEKRRHDEDALFNKMDSSVSGRDTETVYRDRKTGKRRDMDAEAQLETEKELKKRMHDDKFKKWGKGLIQQQKQDQAVNEAMYEMSKPLARSVNDSDRDAVLKAIDREGDPMLEYVSRKKSKASTVADARPKYKGSAPMNRYGILPGYRWDGVDRSNGFEKERYNRISNRVAVTDQAYKWSTEDM